MKKGFTLLCSLLVILSSSIFSNATTTQSLTSDKSDVAYYIGKAQSTIREALNKTDLKSIQELAYKAKRYAYDGQCEADECNLSTAEAECEDAAFSADRAYRASSVKEAKEYLNKALNYLSRAKSSL